MTSHQFICTSFRNRQKYEPLVSFSYLFRNCSNSLVFFCACFLFNLCIYVPLVEQDLITLNTHPKHPSSPPVLAFSHCVIRFTDSDSPMLSLNSFQMFICGTWGFIALITIHLWKIMIVTALSCVNKKAIIWFINGFRHLTFQEIQQNQTSQKWYYLTYYLILSTKKDYTCTLSWHKTYSYKKWCIIFQMYT